MFNSSRSATRGTGVAKRRCTALTVPSASGFSLPRAGMQKTGIEDVVAGQRGVAGMELAFAPLEDQRSDSLGVVPPDLLGDGAEELEGGDHAFEDRLGALERQGDHEGGVGVGPGGDEEGDVPPTVGEVDVDVSEVGFEALAGEMSQGDEGLAVRAVVLRR